MFSKKYIVPLAAGLLLAGSSALADTTTTETVKTTTTTIDAPAGTTVVSSPATTYTTITLSPSGVYRVIDPRTGQVIGAFDPATNLVAGRALSPGYVITDTVTGKVVAVVGAAGTLGDIAVVPVSDSMVTEINNRRAAFDQAIASSLASGTITAADAAAMRAELDRIRAEQAAASTSGTITYAEALNLADQLDMFEQRYTILVSAAPTPLLRTHFVVTNNVVTITDEIAFRRAAFERRIDAEYKLGHLSTSQVASLKEDLNDITSKQAKYMKDGVLSDSERKTLNTKLNRVQERLDSDIAVIESKRAHIGIKTE